MFQNKKNFFFFKESVLLMALYFVHFVLKISSSPPDYILGNTMFMNHLFLLKHCYSDALIFTR